MLADAVAGAVDTRTAKFLTRAALQELEEEENSEERRKAREHLKAMTELVRPSPAQEEEEEEEEDGQVLFLPILLRCAATARWARVPLSLVWTFL